MSDPRYSIGIDLGTTHCALSYVDLAASDGDAAAQQVLPVAQLSSPGAIDTPALLPSFLYLPHPGELAAGDLTLPWTASRDYAVGEMARSRGAGARRSCPATRRPKSSASRRSRRRCAT